MQLLHFVKFFLTNLQISQRKMHITVFNCRKIYRLYNFRSIMVTKFLKEYIVTLNLIRNLKV